MIPPQMSGISYLTKEKKEIQMILNLNMGPLHNLNFQKLVANPPPTPTPERYKSTREAQ